MTESKLFVGNSSRVVGAEIAIDLTFSVRGMVHERKVLGE